MSTYKVKARIDALLYGIFVCIWQTEVFLRFFNYFKLFVGFLLRTCATNYIWSYHDSSSSETPHRQRHVQNTL